MTDAQEFDRTKLWHYRASWLHLDYYDGDTFTALVDTGFFARHRVAIRIADLYAPEMTEDGGFDAKRRLGLALISGMGEWPIRIVTRQRVTAVSEVRSFERWVADVWVETAYGLQEIKGMVE